MVNYLYQNLMLPLLLALPVLISSCASAPRIEGGKRSCFDLPLVVKWSAPELNVDENEILRPLKGYRLYLKPSESKSYSEYISLGNVTQYKIDHLKKGMSYDLKVAAYNENGESRASRSVNRKICQ